MTNQNKSSEPVVPEIESCPYCGHHVLIGDVTCSNCGRNLQSSTERLMSIPANVVSFTLFAIGVMVSMAAFTGMDGLGQFIALIVGFGFIAGGGLYYAADLLYFNATDQRDKK